MTHTLRTSPAAAITRTIPVCLALPLLSLLLPGCQSWHKTHESALTAWASGNTDVSVARLQEARSQFRSEKELLDLDLAMLDLAVGQPAAAETLFRQKRESLSFLSQKDFGEQTASILTDSRAIAWSGRDFERSMLLNMAMLSSMVSDGQDSFAYSLQFTKAAADRRELIAAALQKKQKDGKQTDSKLADSKLAEQFPPDAADDTTGIARVSYSSENTVVAITASPVDQPLAFGAWLTALVQSETPSRAVETEQALADVNFWNPAFADSPGEKTLTTGLGVRSRKGHGTLAVIALCGHAPQWTAERVEPTSTALLIADRILSATGKYTLPPTISSVKIARPCSTPSLRKTDWIRSDVTANSGNSPQKLSFHRLVDLHAVAEASYNASRDDEIAAAIVRRITKKGVVFALKTASDIHRNTLVDLGVNAAGVAWEALEKPDTRSWRTLPGAIDVATVELPAEPHTLSLASTSFSGRYPEPPRKININIEDGRNTWIVVMIPDQALAGHILVGGADYQRLPVNPPAP